MAPRPRRSANRGNRRPPVDDSSADEAHSATDNSSDDADEDEEDSEDDGKRARSSSLDPSYVYGQDDSDSQCDSPRSPTPLFKYPAGTVLYTPPRSKFRNEPRDQSEELRENVIEAAGGRRCVGTGEDDLYGIHEGMHFISHALKGDALISTEAWLGSLVNVDSRWNIARGAVFFHRAVDRGLWAPIPIKSKEDPTIDRNFWKLLKNIKLPPAKRISYTNFFEQKVFPDLWDFKLVALAFISSFEIQVRVSRGRFRSIRYDCPAKSDIIMRTHINPANMMWRAGKSILSHHDEIPNWDMLSSADKDLIDDVRDLTTPVFDKELHPEPFERGHSLYNDPAPAPKAVKSTRQTRSARHECIIQNDDDDDVQSEPEIDHRDKDGNKLDRAGKKAGTKAIKAVTRRKRAASMSRASTPAPPDVSTPKRSAKLVVCAPERKQKMSAKGKAKEASKPEAPKPKAARKPQPQPESIAMTVSVQRKKNKRAEDDDGDDVEKEIARPKKRGGARR
ncbi:hypothetical protein CYLTODRAFT_494482 [Cylindrobasidium torrendii FP15055 ss-10]|uniref:Uncharacterized protein n=1 Tax=Cylindrobasidium torrendii FP15055 ss-10 TaxID=1314674 RepID=A0A0D7AXQ1_9AGAR|nr:hypothetical protein CYLTODRAFT_494482 [Cylindrobasidium torrendii FP15055 ss-10]